ncbi:hypothetical protein ES705_05277 [subsurface metagenome]|nr:hypothetical protein [Clostridia bacterium]
MGDKTAHVAQAQHNDRFIHFLNIRNTQYLDWVISVIYYTAVNYIEAFIFEKVPGGHSDQVARNLGLSSPHKARKKIISEKLSGIKNNYKTLKNASEYVRYAKVDYKFYKIHHVLKFYQTDLSSIKRHLNY